MLRWLLIDGEVRSDSPLHTCACNEAFRQELLALDPSDELPDDDWYIQLHGRAYEAALQMREQQHGEPADATV